MLTPPAIGPTPETVTLSSDARFKLRETLRGIPGSHEQWPDIQDVLESDTVDAAELLNILAAIGAAVRAIVTAADRELAQLRRERDTARPCPGATRPANAARAQQIQPFAGTQPAPARAAKEYPR